MATPFVLLWALSPVIAWRMSIPSALCGLVGIKATYGRVSEHGAAPLTWSMGHVGPIAGSVRDVALVIRAGAVAVDRR